MGDREKEARPEVCLTWEMTPGEWDQLVGVLRQHADVPYIAALIVAGKVPGPEGSSVLARPGDPEHEGVYYTRLRTGEVDRTVAVTEDPLTALADVDAEGCVLGVEVLDGGDWRDALAALARSGRLVIREGA